MIPSTQQKDGYGRTWYIPDIRPGDIIRIKKRLCVGHNSHKMGTYSLLYRVMMIRGSQHYPTIVVRRLDQHANLKTPILQLSGQYLKRGKVVKRIHAEPYTLGDMRLVG